MKNYDLCMNTENYWSKVSGLIADYVFTWHQALCQQPTIILTSAGLCVFFPWCKKASMFQHKGGVVVHVKNGKYVSPKKNVNFKRQGWSFIVDSSLEDRCFQLVSKKKKSIKSEIIF